MRTQMSSHLNVTYAPAPSVQKSMRSGKNYMTNNRQNYGAKMINEDDEFERVEREQKMRLDLTPRKPWSQQTIEERLDHAIRIWEKNLARVDHDGTALNHDTYDKDPVRFSTATDYQTFVQVLHSIRGTP